MSTPWIVLIESDLDTYLVGAQRTALTSAALAAGQVDPFNDVMLAVSARIRASIQGCQANRVSITANSIPPSFKDFACYLILQDLAARLPSLKFTDQQALLANEARRYLRDVRDCKEKVELPPDPLSPPSIQVNSAVVVVTSSPVLTTRAQTDGL
jgi:hypothetical protein